MKKLFGGECSEEEFDEATNKWFAKHALKKSIEKTQKEKIIKYSDSLSKEKFEELFFKFLSWEHEYEEMYYARYIETHSTLFGLVVDIAEEHGKPVLVSLDENFLHKAFRWNGFIFKLYVGQGSFWRIQKGKKVIFQSS